MCAYSPPVVTLSPLIGGGGAKRPTALEAVLLEKRALGRVFLNPFRKRSAARKNALAAQPILPGVPLSESGVYLNKG